MFELVFTDPENDVRHKRKMVLSPQLVREANSGKIVLKVKLTFACSELRVILW
jgi:hypothetical protein